jgi:uncharacterized membrane protein
VTRAKASAAAPPRAEAPTAAPARAASQRPRRWVPWLLAGAAYVGFVISLYLTFVHYRGYVSPCYVVHGCEEVQTSKYSVILGVPLALVGTLFFGLMFYLGIGLLTGPAVLVVRAYKVLAFAGALAIIPLFLLQAIVLKAFCTYCVATEALMLVLWVASFWLAAAAPRPSE